MVDIPKGEPVPNGQEVVNAVVVGYVDEPVKSFKSACTLGKKEFEEMTMDKVLQINNDSIESNFGCYLKYYHGFQESLVFYYAYVTNDTFITDVQKRKEDCVVEFVNLPSNADPAKKQLIKDKARECIKKAEGDLTSFLTVSLPQIAFEMTETKEDRMNTAILLCQCINMGSLYNDQNNHDEEGGKKSINVEELLKLTSKQAKLYIDSGILKYVLDLDKKAGIYANCDADISNESYYDKSNPFANSKSRSLLNLGYKNQCPAHHTMVTPANYDKLWMNKNHRKTLDLGLSINLFRRQNGCCLYTPSIRNVAKTLVAASFWGKGVWKWASLQKIAHKAIDNIGEDLIVLRLDIKRIQVELEKQTNPVKRLPLESQLHQLNKTVELLQDQAAYIQLTDKTEMFEKAQRELEAYRASWLANTGSEGDQFVERIRIEIIYGIEIMIKKHLFTVLKDKVKKADKLSVKNVMINLRAAKDYSLGILIWMIKHPKFALFIMDILEKYKKEICDRIAVENGKFKIEESSKVNFDKVKSEALEKGYWIALGALTDPAAINKLITKFSAGTQIFTSSMGPYGMALSGVMHILQLGFSENIMRAINTSAWTLTYMEGMKKFMKLLDFSRCGVEAAIIANSLKLKDDNKFTKRAREIIGFYKHNPIKVVLPQNPPLKNIEFALSSDNSRSYYVAILALGLMEKAKKEKTEYEEKARNDINLPESEFKDDADMMAIVDKSQPAIKIAVFKKLAKVLKDEIPLILQNAEQEFERGKRENLVEKTLFKPNQTIMDAFPKQTNWKGIEIVREDLLSLQNKQTMDTIDYADDDESVEEGEM